MTRSKTKKINERIDEYSKFLFNYVSENDVLTFRNGRLIHNGVVLNKEQINELSEEAKSLRKLPLFNILVNEIKYLGNKKIYNESETLNDLVVGKAVLLTLDVLCRKIDNIANFK